MLKPMKYRADFKKSCVHKLRANEVETIKHLGCELNGYKWERLVAAEYDIDTATVRDILSERTHKDIRL